MAVLDEVSLGLATTAVDRLHEALRAFAQAGVAVMLAEQNVGRDLSLASHVCQLSQGQVALSVTTEVAADAALRALYVSETTDA